ncbi:acetoin utilization protein AcuC, partial [bacterium]|nr:acetoin utilization protein AcuC [bacterium]
MDVALVFSPSLGAYDLGPEHPLKPERVLRTVSLIEAYGLLAEEGPLHLVGPTAASREDLLRVHDVGYVDDVQRISSEREPWAPHRGIGPGDTPGFTGMHEASALVAGATMAAVEAVRSGEFCRAFSPAGGLHHAHRDHAAGFCVYNDPAVGIAAALSRDPSLRVLYLDVDAHHGDGVQEAFYEEPRVLTVSLHEDGRYLYPGTGSWRERGAGAGEGSAINVPLPPYATAECFLLALDEVVAPAARAFAPDLIVAQCGADAHWSDPLTSLGMTLDGFDSLYQEIVRLADE